MPRKKRKSCVDGAGLQSLEGEEEVDSEEQEQMSAATKKCISMDAFIVISDSEGEQEMMEKSGLQKRRTKPQLDRAKLAVRRRIAQMTEEEQLALAVKMSEQEASHMSSQQEEEEELLRKAIAASLNNCYPSDSWEQSTALPEQAMQVEEEVHLEVLGFTEAISDLSESTQATSDGQTAVAKSPVVLLQRLSQDIVDSSSIILSPGRENLFAKLIKEPLTPLVSDSSDSLCSSPCSPIFPCRSLDQLVPRKLFADSGTRLQAESQQLDKCSDIAGSPKLEPSAGSQPKQDYRAEEKEQAGTGKGAVHYYWGIPFCPRGVDPSQYTQVILCQLEVYQKNLKLAQRQLLQKKEYGEPVLPCTSALRLSEHDKGNEKDVESQGATEEAGQEEKRGEEAGPAGWQSYVNSNKSLRSPVHDQEAEVERSEPADTAASNGLQSSQALFVEETPEDEENEQVALSTVALAAESDGQAPAAGTCRPMEEEEMTICPETQPSPSHGTEAESTQIPPAGHLVPVQACSNEDTIDGEYVQCPLCGQDFPPVKIELHAAYCDGQAKLEEKQHISVLTRRQKGKQNQVPSGPDVAASLQIGRCEKCYVCKSLVLLREYQRHVDNCLQTAVLETEGSRRLRSTKVGRCEGRLLSMLEQSESKCWDTIPDAEVKSSAPELGAQRAFPSGAEEEHEAAGCSHHAWSPTVDFQLSESPIKSFVGISEATDCLVDFKQQFSKRPNSGCISRAGRGRRKRRT
ncbi:BRCA1-A complex subunit RAP80 isoform X2 [Rhinatrema bivittatum]|uniref:BRCA1-A complex subunit RAP80 isoform X2 n=1 Tax=Rhinatrema bivittatum TaxID=194408 RepID=UPI001128DE1A|nr:BRCA1-A complex subunit RAP80 isoform X2 [Rhinatrema bivittatum]